MTTKTTLRDEEKADWDFVNSMAQSLGTKDVDDLAMKLNWAEGGKPFKNAQALAEFLGLQDIRPLFLGPGNHDRYATIACYLSAVQRLGEKTVQSLKKAL